jgi:rhodanese-related sulfurtransferase
MAMKKLFALIMTVALGSTAFAQGAQAPGEGAAAKAPAFKAHVLTNAELDKLFEDPGKVLLIDVRRPDEVSTNGGFPVYLSIQFSQLDSSLDWIPKGRPIVTVSNHAARAGKAADLLASKGFKVLGAAGADTYAKEGGKHVAKIPIPAPKTADASAAH